MAVRVKIVAVGPRSHRIEATAVLNGGFETDEPCILLPARAAAAAFGKGIQTGRTVKAEVAGGRAEFTVPKGRVEVRVVADDRSGPATACDVLISKEDREVLLSDSAIDALGVKIESFRPGQWRFSDETVVRPGESPLLW